MQVQTHFNYPLRIYVYVNDVKKDELLCMNENSYQVEAYLGDIE